jgi:hypothetical protein
VKKLSFFAIQESRTASFSIKKKAAHTTQAKNSANIKTFSSFWQPARKYPAQRSPPCGEIKLVRGAPIVFEFTYIYADITFPIDQL